MARINISSVQRFAFESRKFSSGTTNVHIFKNKFLCYVDVSFCVGTTVNTLNQAKTFPGIGCVRYACASATHNQRYRTHTLNVRGKLPVTINRVPGYTISNSHPKWAILRRREKKKKTKKLVPRVGFIALQPILVLVPPTTPPRNALGVRRKHHSSTRRQRCAKIRQT